MPKSHKTSKKRAMLRKTHKRHHSRKSSRRKMRGGCGCNAQMAGGNTFTGVVNGLGEIPADRYYPVSDDSRLEGTNLSSRIIGGGKKRRTSKARKMFGGNYVAVDAVSSLGNATDLNGVKNLLQNVGQVNTDLNSQPVVNTYSVHSPPLV